MNNKGFTFIELLAIISTITILSTFIFIDYGSNSKVFDLDRAAQKIAQDMRLMQQQSLSGIDGGVNTNGYGLYFSIANNNYSTYQNNNANPYYDTGDVIIKTIDISSDINIESLKRDNTSLANLSVSFFPPGPMTYIEDYSSSTEGFITLYLVNDESEKRMIKVNSSGRIEVIKI